MGRASFSSAQGVPGWSWLHMVGTATIPPMEGSSVQAPESAVLCVSCELTFGDMTMNFEPQC